MKDEPDLFTNLAPKHFPEMYPEHPGYTKTGGDTSLAAAESIAPSADSIRAKIKAFIAAQAQGATCDEIELSLDLRHQTASARVRELVLFKEIKDSGDRRETRSGRGARVYVLMPASAEAV